MKKSNLFRLVSLGGLTCMMGMLSSCSPDSIVIKGKVANADGKPVVFYRTNDGIYTQIVDTLQLQPDSSFTITLPGKSAERFNFFLWGAKALGSVYLKPGITELNIDASAETPIETADTPENRVMKLLSALDRDVWDLRARKGDKWEIAKDTVASSVYDKLTAYSQTLDKELTGVDDAFKRKAIQDIRMQLLLAFENQFMGTSYRASEPTKKEWCDVFYKMIEFSDLNNPDNVFSPAFQDAISNKEGIIYYDINKSGQPKDTNESNEILFDLYVKNLQGRVQEVAMANIIMEDYQRQEYATNIPELYNRFLALYPQTVLKPVLDEAVAKNKSFNEITLSDDIRFMDADSIKTLKEITNRFPGKVIFIDLWATWCGPCRESFAHVKPLQQYANENDVVLLYISIDRPSEKDKWMKMANFYDLKGEHVIINDFFKQEIYDTFGHNGGLYIPHCAIVNTKGELQFPSASSPEEMDKLIGQLKEAVK